MTNTSLRRVWLGIVRSGVCAVAGILVGTAFWVAFILLKGESLGDAMQGHVEDALGTWQALTFLGGLVGGGVGLFSGIWGIKRHKRSTEPCHSRPQAASAYKLLITDADITCEATGRKPESIGWDKVKRIWFVTTTDGPWLPDSWILLEGEQGGCSFPTEATGFERIWDELKLRFPGLDYQPMIDGGTNYSKRLCWEKGQNS